jgi:thioredoxin reductase (NADPH)
VASIDAARDGMEAIVLDRSALGGQAGVSERIDNYPGFPEGVAKAPGRAPAAPVSSSSWR